MRPAEFAVALYYAARAVPMHTHQTLAERLIRI